MLTSVVEAEPGTEVLLAKLPGLKVVAGSGQGDVDLAARRAVPMTHTLDPGPEVVADFTLGRGEVDAARIEVPVTAWSQAR